MFKLGKLDVALSHTEMAVRSNPKDALAQHQLSEILFASGRFAEAEGHSRAAVQIQPKETIMLNALGLTLAAQKKWSEAEDVFSRALELTQQAGDQSFSEEISTNLLEVRNNKPVQ